MKLKNETVEIVRTSTGRYTFVTSRGRVHGAYYHSRKEAVAVARRNGYEIEGRA
jgi:hypothetical protein